MGFGRMGLYWTPANQGEVEAGFHQVRYKWTCQEVFAHLTSTKQALVNKCLLICTYVFGEVSAEPV